MFYRIVLRILVILSVFSMHGIAQTKISDSLIIRLADPTVFFHKDVYYLYGTVGGDPHNGFLVYTSTDLKKWKLSSKNDGYALKKGDAFGTMGFWAPQVFSHDGKFFMAYTANENIAIAVSDSPLGPFTQPNKLPLQAPVKQIDPFVFIDDDGKKYLYHVRLTKGNRIFVAEMNSDLSSIKPETIKECIEASEGWENTANSKWSVAEGPSILKFNNVYYLFYSANDFRSPDYAVGYATSKSPLGPWVKHEGNPILSKEMVGTNGPGHGDFFSDGNELFYVFHTHNSNEKVHFRKTALVPTELVKTNGTIDRFEFDASKLYYLRKQ
jgi:beta-xylosidase